MVRPRVATAYQCLISNVLTTGVRSNVTFSLHKVGQRGCTAVATALLNGLRGQPKERGKLLCTRKYFEADFFVADKGQRLKKNSGKRPRHLRQLWLPLCPCLQQHKPAQVSDDYVHRGSEAHGAGRSRWRRLFLRSPGLVRLHHAAAVKRHEGSVDKRVTMMSQPDDAIWLCCASF